MTHQSPSYWQSEGFLSELMTAVGRPMFVDTRHGILADARQV